jgi:hypothetical protein
MTVNPILPVSVSITPSENTVCEGTSVTFTPTPTNGGTPAYQWFKNTEAVGTGSTYTYVPVNGDQVYVVMTSSLSCKSGSPATSNIVAMVVSPLLPVGVSVSPSANPVIAGTSVIFSATPGNGGINPIYQWKVNGINAGINSPTYSYIPSNNDEVTCIMISDEVCTSGNPASSQPVLMIVEPLELQVTPQIQNVTFEAGNVLFNVSSNSSWTAASDQTWCTVTASGSGTGILTASFEANLSATSRTAHITVEVSGLTPLEMTLIQDAASNKTLNLTVLLEGLFNGSTMNKVQDATGDKFSGTVADQITVELHNSASPYTLAGGPYTIDVNTDGTASVTIPGLLSSSYYIVVKHRNSLETWNGVPLSFSGATVSYNFSTSATQAYGNNLKLVSGKYVLYSGDVNQDGVINTADISIVDASASAFATGYIPADINGDGIVDASDLISLDNNAAVFIVRITP